MAPRSKSTKSKAPRKSSKAAATAKLHRRRLLGLAGVLLVAYIAVGARLVQVQLYPDVRFSEAEQAHIGQTRIDRPRGDILDREGRLLATDRTTLSLAVNARKVDDPETLIAYLDARLDFDVARVRDGLYELDAKGERRPFVSVKRYMDDAEVAALGKLDAAPSGEALMFKPERIRFYPNGELAAHVLGFSDLESKGKEGIEFKFDRYLRSEPGRKVSRVDRKRRLLNFLELEYEPPTGGSDVVLTLDAALQHTLEESLDRALEDKQGHHAMGLLMDPHTGAILALATRPAFDPNAYWDYTDEERKNRAVVDVFEPGSAFKIVTAAAALELGFITPNDLIDCEGGRFNPYGHTINDTHERGVIPFWQCFSESSNIAMIKVAAILGEERLEHWIRRFGFGEKTGVELPMESAGLVWSRDRWSKLTMGSLPIGQEIAVNAIQMARAFAVIANGGYLVDPHLVSRAVSPEGDLAYAHDSTPGPRILSAETAATMKDLCHSVVVGEESTGRFAAIPEYRVGGKTGTAQIARPKEEGGGYYDRKYTAVFAGFAPINAPRLVCVVVMSEPKYGVHWGGRACGPVFQEVMREALIHLNVPEDPMLPGDLPSVATRVAKRPAADADTVVARLNLDAVEPLEPGFNGGDVLELRHAVEGEPYNGPCLPSLVGLTKREAVARLVELGIAVDPRGAGRVVDQSPAPGTPLDDVAVCQLIFTTEQPTG